VGLHSYAQVLSFGASPILRWRGWSDANVEEVGTLMFVTAGGVGW
jgi:hypothetical protein